jgi:hypothetical protein
MRARAKIQAAIAVIALIGTAGCGDNDNTTIILDNDNGTPTAASRTATPAGAPTATPAANPTPTLGGTSPSNTSSGETPSGSTPSGSGGTPASTPTPGGTVNPQVKAMVGDLVPFLTAGAGLAIGVDSSALTADRRAEAVKVDDCPDGGTRTDDEGIPVKTITLDACRVSDAQLGSFEFTGDIVINVTGGTVEFDFTATDLTNDRDIDFAGTLTGTAQSGGFVLNGPLTVSTPDADFTLTFSNLTIGSDRKLVSGSANATDDDDVFDVASLNLTVNSGGQTANVLATFDDDTTQSYVLNLETGDLTPTT